jgi:hypothetical protein
MEPDTERQRAWSTAKSAVHEYARDSTDSGAAKVGAALQAIREMNERAFWRQLQLTHPDATARESRALKTQTDRSPRSTH